MVALLLVIRKCLVNTNENQEVPEWDLLYSTQFFCLFVCFHCSAMCLPPLLGSEEAGFVKGSVYPHEAPVASVCR